MHGTLKIVLQNPLKCKFVYSFNTEIELDKILSKLDPQYQESRENDVVGKVKLFDFFSEAAMEMCSSCLCNIFVL